MTIQHEMRLGLPIMGFDDDDAFGRWLGAAPRTSPGIWLKLVKKGASITGISKAAAIDVALCHGWIDGQQHPYDADFWLTRFTPRRPASRWSQINRTRVLELIADGRMECAGLAEIEAAQADRRWHVAYAPASTAQPSPELQAGLDASPRAAAAFAAFGRADRYAILYRITNLRTRQGRDRVVAEVMRMLARGGDDDAKE
jgi:uncharacterized protein YdeI (YjbR/CyaY-like superfamily)